MKTFTVEFHCFASPVIGIDDVRVADNGKDVQATITFNGKRLPAFRGELYDSKIDRCLAQNSPCKNDDLLDELYLICLEKFGLIEHDTVIVDCEAIEAADPGGFHAALDTYYLLLEQLWDAIDEELCHCIEISQEQYVSELTDARDCFGSADCALFLDLYDGEVQLRHVSDRDETPLPGAVSHWVLLAELDGIPADCSGAALDRLLCREHLLWSVDMAICSERYDGREVRAKVVD